MTRSRTFAVLAALVAIPGSIANGAADPGVEDGHSVREFPVLLDVEGAGNVRSREVPYYEDDGVALHVDLFRPDDVGRGRELPTVVVLNAAGDAPGSPARAARAYRSWARAFAATGLGAAIFDLRRDHAVTDLERAFAFLRDDGPTHGVDPDRIGIWAAGVDVPGATGAVAAGPAVGVRCLALFYGVPGDDPPPDLPVLVVVVGRDDPPARDAQRAAAIRWLERGARVEIVQLPDARHGFDRIDDASWTRTTVRRTLAFFREHLAGPAEAGDRSPGLTPLQRATAHYAVRDWNAAATAYLSYVWENPGDPVAQFRMGRSAALSGLCDQALPALARAADLEHRKGESLILAAACMAESGEGDLAYENLRRAGIVAPERLVDVYADRAFAAIRGRDDVRDLLRTSASWSEVRMTAPDEPGTPLTLTLRLVAPDGSPAAGARVHAYQTGDDGLYAAPDGRGGDPRLFAHAVADDAGRVVLHTVVPGAYPGGSVPRHVHYEVVRDGDGETAGEVTFPGDPPRPDDDGVARVEARVVLR